MARYKGKREASRGGSAAPWEKSSVQQETGEDVLMSPQQQEPAVQEMPASEPVDMDATRVIPTLQAETGSEDPFADPFEEEGGKKGIAAMLEHIWGSRKGKIITTVVFCLLAFGVGAAIALRGWVKPPDITGPNGGDKVQQNQQKDPADTSEDDPDAPSDDELYPDDGYDGDMPTVSGNRKEGVYTFLLVGTDKDDGNTDTIMVVSYDTVNQAVNIMSIPRDTMINESWDIKKINSVYSRTGGSIDALSNRVRKLVGFKPDFYVKVDLGMFVQLVDLIGGVEFDVPQDMNYDDPYQDLHIHLKKGVQVLDGDKAMQLVRFRRYAEGDIKRVEVQQNFMKALIKECLSLKHWGKIKAYIELALDNVQTDLEFGSVVWFAANVMGLNDAPMLNMDNVYTCTIPGNYFNEAWSRDTSSMQSYVTIYPNQVVSLVNERFNPYEQKVNTGMLDVMSILSNGDIASSVGLKDTKHNAIMAVQRGEAYYDADGKIIYGTPPSKVEVLVDPFGNYYILDDAGNIVYTDESGTPLEGVTGPDVPVIPTVDVPVDGNPGNQPPQQPFQPEPVPEVPVDPVLPEQPSDDDSEIPDWLA